MQDMLKNTEEISKTSTEIVFSVSGYESLIEQDKLSEHLEFSSDDQNFKICKDFIETDVLYTPSADKKPDCFMSDSKTYKLLKKTIKNINQTNWYAHYNLAVRYINKEKFKKANKHLKKRFYVKKMIGYIIHLLA